MHTDVAPVPGSKLRRGVDGRTVAARRFRALVADLATDCGERGLSAADLALIRQAAALTVRSEELQAALCSAARPWTTTSSSTSPPRPPAPSRQSADPLEASPDRKASHPHPAAEHRQVAPAGAAEPDCPKNPFGVLLELRKMISPLARASRAQIWC
jgi:hypothetical protein